MVRNAIAASLGCLYIIVSALIVQSEGVAHRNALRQARDLASSASKSATVEAPVESRTETVRRPSSSADPAPGSVAVTEATPPAPSPAPKEVRPPVVASAPVPAAAAIVDAKTPNPVPETVKPATPGPTAAGAPTTLPKDIDPFWNQPEVKKAWDLSHLSTDDEKRLGLELHGMVIHFNRIVDNGALQQRVDEAAEPLLAARSRKDIEYTFTILESEAVNAFSHPGGHVYVTRGLLDWIGEDENYVLQFVLAHEIFHVDRQHALKCLQDPGVRKLPIGTLQAFYLLIFPRGYYPDSMDFDADAWALQRLETLRFTRRECLTFPRKLKGYAEANNFVKGRALPLSGRVASLFDNHFRAHPAARERLKRLEALMEPASTKPK
jgi:hypothetical protein